MEEKKDCIVGTNLIKSLILAKSNFSRIKKNKECEIPGRKTYRYADLEAITDAVDPGLKENGLFINFNYITDTINQKFEVWDNYKKVNVVKDMKQIKVEAICTLYHVSGESMSNSAVVEMICGINDNIPQKIGSAETYARRYALCAMLGVVSEDDTDGQELKMDDRDYSAPRKIQPEEKQRANVETKNTDVENINEILSKMDADDKEKAVEAIRDYFKVENGVKLLPLLQGDLPGAKNCLKIVENIIKTK